LVSRAGVIGLYNKRDTAGPMARTVTDLVHLLGVIAGVDPADAATAEASGKIPITYSIMAPKPRESGECRLKSPKAVCIRL
jgi:amidase